MKLTLKEIKQKYRDPRDKQVNIPQINRYIYSNLAMPFVKLLSYTPITPNQVTLTWMFLGIAGSICLVFNDYRLGILGAILLQLHILVDFMDGTLARLKKISSLNGTYLEQISHNFVRPVLFICLAWAAYMNSGSNLILFLGILAVASVSLHPLIFLDKIQIIIDQRSSKNQNNVQKQNVKQKSRSKGFIQWLYQNIVYPLYTSDFLTHFVLIGAIFGKLDYLVIFYGVTYPLLVIATMSYEYIRGFDWVYDLFE